MPVPTATASSDPLVAAALSDDTYDLLLASVRARFATLGDQPLYTTDAHGVYDAFLAALPADARPAHTCFTCREFVKQFGKLVTIDARGRTHAAMWSAEGAPEAFRAPIAAMARTVEAARVTGVFVSDKVEWGRPLAPATGPVTWAHFSVTPKSGRVYVPSPVKSRYQVAAEKRADFAILQRGLDEFPAELVARAQTLLTNGALYRSEKCEGVARWLRDCHASRDGRKDPTARENLTWRAVATAPTGYCHVRSTMIGTLLEDLAADLPFETVKRKFDAKMHPLQYQRPTAPPSAENIARAEAIVAALRTAGALDRRFARLADLETLWRPQPEPKATGGVFAHLRASTATRKLADMPPVTLTWEKFARTVLPDAIRIDYRVPAENGPFYALVTAALRDAPPIIQWDRVEARNPVTWYTYPSGSSAKHWNLTGDVWHPVTAVSLLPMAWGAGGFEHQGHGVMFVLAGAKDLQHTKGAGLFPELMRSEYHEIRRTIEAYSASAVIAGRDEAEACGVCFRKSEKVWRLATVCVTAKTGEAVVYALDRWD